MIDIFIPFPREVKFLKGNKCDLNEGGKRHDEISKRARRIAKIYGCVYESVSARDNPTDIIILLQNALNS